MPVWSGALMSKLPRASATKFISADSSPSSAALYGLVALLLVRGRRDFPGAELRGSELRDSLKLSSELAEFMVREWARAGLGEGEGARLGKGLGGAPVGRLASLDEGRAPGAGVVLMSGGRPSVLITGKLVRSRANVREYRGGAPPGIFFQGMGFQATPPWGKKIRVSIFGSSPLLPGGVQHYSWMN